MTTWANATPEQAAEAHRVNNAVDAWAHETGTTGAKEQARVAKAMRKGMSLHDAVRHMSKQLERDTRRGLGDDLYERSLTKKAVDAHRAWADRPPMVQTKSSEVHSGGGSGGGQMGHPFYGNQHVSA